MKTYDIKHIVYHVLVAIYFIWFIVFGILQVFALHSFYEGFNLQLKKILFTWIFLNLFMGTALFIVIWQFGRKAMLWRIIFYAYWFMLASSVTTVLIIMS
jgi:hypothetical protein